VFSWERWRQALRLLLRHKRFAALAMISLAVAIALNTTMYGVLDTMIAPKLAIKDHEQLHLLQFLGNYRGKIPERDIEKAKRDGLSFVEAWTGSQTRGADISVEGGGNVREADIVVIRPNYFRVLGVRATNGRLINETDVGNDSRPVVVSERLWKELFPAQERFAPAVISIAGEPYTMVGTLPFEADFPGRSTGVYQLPADTNSVRESFIRVKKDFPPERMGAELETLRLQFAAQTGEFNPGDAGWRFWRLTKRPFSVGRFHIALIGSVFAVLLVACSNLANLQLARGMSRTREFATRAAVGATRRDIIAQLVIESAWLAIGGLLLSVVLTMWGMHLVEANLPPRLFEYVTHPQVSWRVAAFALGATLFCLMLMGLAPAWKLSRVDINELLKSGAGTGSTRSSRRQYGLLVVIEVGLALSVLCSASLLVRAALDVANFDSGLSDRAVVSTRVFVKPTGPADRRTRAQWTEHLANLARLVPGITHSAVHRFEGAKRRAVSIDDPGGAPKTFPASLWSYRVVTPDYFRTMGIPIVKGRDFSVNEFAEPLVIVDQITAAYLWPGSDPIGRLIKLDSAHGRSPWLKVVGVSKNYVPFFNRNEYERNRGIEPRLNNVYVLLSQDTTTIPMPPKGARFSASFSLVVRGAGDPMKVPATLHRGLQALGPETLVLYPLTWEQANGIERLRQKHSFMASLFLVFGLMALGLAALGVYSIIAHMVAQRTREFGVRIAIGAATYDIRQLVVREGNVLALAGIAAGLLITAYSAGFVREFVFSDDDRFDSRVFAVVSVFIFAVAWLASYIPARRAMRINPVEALKND
jgi:putative ABC transport system permease protein